MEAPHGYVRLLATKQGLGYLHPHTLPFDFVIDEIAHDFTDEYEDDENDIDDLTVVDHKMAANQPRVPAGSSAGGQFGSTGGGAGAGSAGGAGGQTDTAEFKAWFGDSKVVDADGNPQVVYHGGGPNEGFDHEFIGAATLLGPGFYFTSDADQASEYVLGNDRGGAVKPVYISIQNPMVISTDVSGHARDSAIKKQLPASAIESLIKSSPVANPPGPQSPSQQERTARNVKDAITQFSSASEHDAFVGIGREFYGQGFNDSANHFESYLTKFTAATGYDGIISGTMTPGPASLVLRPKIVVVAFQPQQIKSSIGNSGAFDPTSRDITKMAANQPRVPAGSSAGGQFGSTGGGGAGSGAAGGAGKQTDTAEFRAWFGDSKVVDADGNPVVVFHGTHTPIGATESPQDKSGIFFSSDADVANAYAVRFGNSLDGGEAYDKLRAKLIAQGVDKNEVQTAPEWQALQAITRIEGSQVAPVYLKISNPLVLDGNKAADAATANRIKDSPAEHAKLKAQGYDGIIIHNVIDRPVIAYTAEDAQLANKKASVFVVFSTTQIKSSIGNSGAFDPTSRDITKMAANQPRVPAGSSAGGQFGSTSGAAAGGGAAGGGSESSVEAAVQKLNALPLAGEGYRHFSNRDGPEIRMTEFGLHETPEGLRLYGPSIPDKVVVDKIKTEMVLDPSTMDIRYAQSSVVRAAVERKIRGIDTGLLVETGNPDVVKEDGVYYLQGGHHRAAASIMLTGTFKADVIEVKSKNKRGKRIWGKVDTATKMAANQPRVPAGSSAGGQFGSTSGAAAGGGAGGDSMAASEALLTPTTGHYENAPDRTVSPGNEAAVAYGKENFSLFVSDSPESVALANYTGAGYGETNNLIRANDGLYENLTGRMEASYLSGPRNANGRVDNLSSKHAEATSVLEDKIRTTYSNGLQEYKGNPRTIDASESAQALQHTSALARLVDNAPALQPTVVYRGVGGNSPGVRLTDMQEAMNSGGTVKLNGFTSTSLNPHVAHDFSDNNDRSYVVAIVTRRGLVVNGGPTPGVMGESEVIIPHGTTFKVHAILPAAPGTFYRNKPVVQMIQVDAPATKMAVNQPRVPAGSSAGGQFGSTSGAAGGSGAGGGSLAESEALLTPTTGFDVDEPDATVSKGNSAAIAYGEDYEFEVDMRQELDDGDSPKITALADYTGEGSYGQNYLVRHNPGLMEFLSSEAQPDYAKESSPSNLRARARAYREELAAAIDRQYPQGLQTRETSARIHGRQAQSQLQHTAVLNTLVNNSPPLKPTVVYRGVKGRTEGARLSDMQAALDSGGTVKLNGFTSTSVNPSVGHQFGASQPSTRYVMAIVTRRGMVVKPPDGYSEGEVIIPHGLSYKVHRIIPALGTRPAIVQMIQVDAPATKMAANQPRVPAGSSAGGQFGSTGGGAGAAGGGAEGSGGGTTEPTQITDEAEIEQAHREVEAWPNDGSYEQNMARELGLASLSDALAGDMLPAMTYVKRDANGKVVGVSQIDGESNARVTVIYLAISPANQGQGLGRQMMAHAAEIAVDQGKGITLSPTGTAVPFYKKLGMKSAPVGARDEGTMSFTMNQAKEFYMRNAQKAARDILNAEIDILEPISGLFALPTTPATKMAANQPRVPAGSSAGGQFGSTSGSGGGAAGGGVAGAEVTLMHGTSYGSGSKILEEGFLPGEGGFVYTTPVRDIAVQYGFGQAQLEAVRTNFEDPNAKFAVVTLKPSIQGFAIDNPSSLTDTWQWTRKGPVLPSEILRVEVFSVWDLTKPVEILLPKSLPATKQTPAIRTLFAVVMLRDN